MHRQELVEKAMINFRDGFSCSQSIFAAFSEGTGLDKETCFKISCGLGAGCSRTGQICGAVSGAYLAIGLKHGKSKPEDNDSRELTYKLVNDFNSNFLDYYPSLNCTDLIGCNLGIPDEQEKAKIEQKFETICAGIVKRTALILQDLL